MDIDYVFLDTKNISRREITREVYIEQIKNISSDIKFILNVDYNKITIILDDSNNKFYSIHIYKKEIKAIENYVTKKISKISIDYLNGMRKISDIDIPLLVEFLEGLESFIFNLNNRVKSAR